MGKGNLELRLLQMENRIANLEYENKRQCEELKKLRWQVQTAIPVVLPADFGDNNENGHE